MSKCDFNGEAFHYRLDNIFISFVSKLYKQIVCINIEKVLLPNDMLCKCLI